MRKTIGVVIAGLLWMAASLSGSAPRNDYAWFEIDDSITGAALLSDTLGPYADYRLTEGDRCVTAWVAPDGLFFTYLYRGSDLGDNCHTVWPGGLRSYMLQFPAGSAPCAEFGVCTLEVVSPGDSPRIRAEKLFAKSAQATPVAFLFNQGASYEVRADDNVYFLVDGQTRTLSYSGTARLWKFGKKGAAPVGGSFDFSFSLTVTRVAP
jgi:hypothetical protein